MGPSLYHVKPVSECLFWLLTHLNLNPWNLIYAYDHRKDFYFISKKKKKIKIKVVLWVSLYKIPTSEFKALKAFCSTDGALLIYESAFSSTY